MSIAFGSLVASKRQRLRVYLVAPGFVAPSLFLLAVFDAAQLPFAVFSSPGDFSCSSGHSWLLS